MEEPSPRYLFARSVRRCLAADEFVPEFYRRFLGISEEIREKFSATDFDRQNRLLRRSLELCASATANDPASLREIHERATTHDRHHLNIRPGLYHIWLEVLLGTARDFDELWDPAVEAAWRRILGYVIRHMTREY